MSGDNDVLKWLNMSKDLLSRLTYVEFSENLGNVDLVEHWSRCFDQLGNENWVMILGDDDVLNNNVIEKFHNKLDFIKPKTNVVRFSSCVIDSEGKQITQIFTHPIWEKAKNAYIRKLMNHTRSSLSEYIFSLTEIKKVGFRNFPLAWHTDDALWLDLCDNEKCIYTINEAIVKIRRSKLNISGIQGNLTEKNKSSRIFFMFLLRKNIYEFNLFQIRILIHFYKDIFKDKSATIAEKLEYVKLTYKYNHLRLADKTFWDLINV